MVFEREKQDFGFGVTEKKMLHIFKSLGICILNHAKLA
jgi:hypothetical protein